MFKLPKLNHYWLEIIFILLVGLIPLLWFKEGYLAAGHDMSYPLAPIDFWLDRLFVWTNRIGSFGSNQTDAIPGIFIHGLQALFYYITGSLQIAQKLDFIFWFTLPGITMYILLRSLHPNKEEFITRISGALFYMLNHYLLQGWIIAEMSKFSIVAAIPLIVLFTVNVIYKEKSIIKNSLLVGFTLFFLNGGAGIPLWGGLAVVWITTLGVLFILNPQPIWHKLRRGLAFVFLSALFVGVLNWYWIYPYVQSFSQNYTARVASSGGNEGAVRWSQEISKNASFDNLIKLQGIPDWYDNPEHPYANNFLNNDFLIFLSVIIPLVSFVGLWSKKNEQRHRLVYKVLALGIIIVALPFVAGSHLPTGVVYDFLLMHLPGFSIFRTPFYKFAMVLWFAYAYLFGVGLKNIIDAIKVHRFIAVGVFCVFLIMLGIYNYPFFTGSFFNWSKKYSTMVKVPNYIFTAKDQMDSNKFSTRTLILPELDPRTKYETNDWKYFSLSTIPSILTRQPIVINDATLRNWEDVLASAVYTQLRKKGDSQLLDYTGVDTAIWRNDFSGRNDTQYSIKANRTILDNSKKFIFRKKTGQWDFYDIASENLKPIIYSPQSVVYVKSEPTYLAYIADIPSLDSFGDAFALADPVNPMDIVKNKISQYVFQASCINCDLKKTEDVPIISSEPPRIMPGSKLYWLIRLRERNVRKKIVEVPKLIDFDLGIMAKNAAALKVLIVNKSKNKTVENIIDNWYVRLDEIKSNYLSIQDKNLKQEKSKDIYRYLWSFILGSQEWKHLTESPSTFERLSAFENDTRLYINKLGLKPVIPPPSSIDKMIYKVAIPIEGSYQISLYSDLLTKSSVLLDGNPIDISRYSPTRKWFQSEFIKLSAGEHILSLSKSTKKPEVYNNVELEAPSAKLVCSNIDLGNVDPENAYTIRFNYSSISGRPLNFQALEKSETSTEWTVNKVYPNVKELPQKDFSYQVDFKYEPGVLAKTLSLRFCMDGYYLSPTYAKVENLSMEEVSPDPLVFVISTNKTITQNASPIEFVSLNQTKYLIRLSKNSDDFILNFNSRFDQQWRIREVDTMTANKFLTGETKAYLSGKVIEYERQDKHIFTDSLFPRLTKLEYVPQFTLNAFNNAWFLEGNIDSGPKTYLLEYIYQNTLYKTSIFSGAAFVFLLVLYFWINKNEKFN